MTQREAIIKALVALGGRARLKSIYPLAIATGLFEGSRNKEATIRNCLLTSPKYFRRSEGKPDGWWELLSFQEEMAELRQRNQELAAENERLRGIDTADGFVARLMEATKNMFATKRNDAKAVQQVLLVLNRMAEQQELTQWIAGKTAKVVKKSSPRINVKGDYVLNKNVENEVGNVERGGTGINVNRDKEQTQ